MEGSMDCTPMIGQIGLVLPRKGGGVIHCSPAITLDTYSHVLPGIQAAARRFDEGLQKTAERASSERVG